MPLNKIVTRGLGPSRGAPGRASLITQGYGGVPLFITQVTTKPRDRHGRSGRRSQDEIELITLWAKLIEVNSKQPNKPIVGSIKVPIKKSMLTVVVQRVTSTASTVIDRVKVTVKRIKRDI